MLGVKKKLLGVKECIMYAMLLENIHKAHNSA